MNFYILLTLAAGIIIGVVWMYVDFLKPCKENNEELGRIASTLLDEKHAYRLRVLKAEGAIQRMIDSYDKNEDLYGNHIGPKHTRDWLSTTIGYKVDKWEGKS